MMGLTLQFVPYSEIDQLSSLGRIKKLLALAKQHKIVLLEGRLKKEEEVELIKTTMESINREFKGIELAVIYPGENVTEDLFQKVKSNVISALLGNRAGITIIGPATVVRKIKQDPDKIQLFTTGSTPKARGVKRAKSRPKPKKKRRR